MSAEQLPHDLGPGRRGSVSWVSGSSAPPAFAWQQAKRFPGHGRSFEKGTRRRPARAPGSGCAPSSPHRQGGRPISLHEPTVALQRIWPARGPRGAAGPHKAFAIRCLQPHIPPRLVSTNLCGPAAPPAFCRRTGVLACAGRPNKRGRLLYVSPFSARSRISDPVSGVTGRPKGFPDAAFPEAAFLASTPRARRRAGGSDRRPGDAGTVSATGVETGASPTSA